MKKTSFYLVQGEAGLVLEAVIAIIFATVALVSVLGYAIKGSQEYNHFHRIAREVVDDPNSHTDEEILNSGEALVQMMSEATQGGTIVPGTGGGMGVSMVLQAEDALRKVRNQQYVIQIVVDPADPAPKQSVTVTITVLNSLQGTPVSYALAGTDNYKQGGTLNTNQSGQISFVVPGGAQGVSDEFTISAGSVTEEYTYTF
ncbi:MAG: hypothetical protein HZC49_02745 [Nitrospirae bacterium]|nr:hypothetical protein [Nitrospirota bacterium]